MISRMIPINAKIADNQIADVVALADRSRFIPRDLGFVVHRVEKLLRITAADRSASPRRPIGPLRRASRVARRARALQRAQALARDLRRRILEQVSVSGPAADV